jgi:adenosylcobinamide kinase/adenosylcobinamide-phosphate guanylyltransferase
MKTASEKRMSRKNPAGRGIVFVTGGARSGKSGFALSEALKIGGKKAFLATAEATDKEMKDRIQRHRDDRGSGWKTYEEPVRIARLLREIDARYPVVVIDCLTLWLANVMMSGLDEEKEGDRLLSALKAMKKAKVIVVSNEVGMGIVPENELARRFRDAAGRLNQRVAAIADEAYVTVSGIPLKIKG